MTPSSAIRQTAVNGPIPSIALDKIPSLEAGKCGRLVVVGRVTSHAHGFAIFAFVSSNTNPSSVMAAYNGIRFSSRGRLLD
jgi:hypothetical protein